jgi:glycosyltransferase involved in cell wall biosynthesis
VKAWISSAGRWSGGGSVVLANLRFAAARHPHCLSITPSRGAVPLIARNVPADLGVLLRCFLWLPQNALPWSAPTPGERSLQRKLRIGSEMSAYRAMGMIRISSALPPLRRRPTSAVLHNVLDEGFDRKLNVEPAVVAQDAFVCIGSAHTYRNLATLIRGYAIYRGEGGTTPLFLQAHTENVSEASRLAALVSTVKGINLDATPATRDDVISLMKAARGIVFPSLVEASPVTLLEAQGLGLRTACSDILAHRELASAGDYLFDPHSIGKTSEALHQLDSGNRERHHLLQDPGQRHAARVLWAQRVADFIAGVHG